MLPYLEMEISDTCADRFGGNMYNEDRTLPVIPPVSPIWLNKLI